MIESPRRYDVTVTVDKAGGHSPNPAEFAVAAERAASARTASIMSTHTASQIVSVVTVLAPGQSVAVAIALAAASKASRLPPCPPCRFS
jgi:hypothetical protein